MGYAAVLKNVMIMIPLYQHAIYKRLDFVHTPVISQMLFLQLLFINHWVLQSVSEYLLCKFNSNPLSMLQHLLRNNKNWHLQTKYTAFLIRAFCTSQ